MKKCSLFAVIATTAVFLTTGIVYSCTKVNDDESQITSNFEVKPKSFTSQYQEKMYLFQYKCDSAFSVDTAQFMHICEQNDVNSFKQMTGITDQLVYDIYTIVDNWLVNHNLQAEDSVSNLGELEDVSEEPDYVCTTCLSNVSLSSFGTIVYITNTHLPACYSDYYQPVDSYDCWRTCSRTSHGDILYFVACLAQCERYLFLNTY